MYYYIYLVSGQEARDYLGGTNFVGVCEDGEINALKKVKSYFKKNTPIFRVSKEQAHGFIGYLY